MSEHFSSCDDCGGDATVLGCKRPPGSTIPRVRPIFCATCAEGRESCPDCGLPGRVMEPEERAKHRAERLQDMRDARSVA